MKKHIKMHRWVVLVVYPQYEQYKAAVYSEVFDSRAEARQFIKNTHNKKIAVGLRAMLSTPKKIEFSVESLQQVT